MKIREGFVSNSSSTSFVIIGRILDDQGNLIVNADAVDVITFGVTEGVLALGDSMGNTTFGWNPEDFRTIGDRINLCWILASEDPTKKSRILEAIQRLHPEIQEITFTSEWAYADHQSASSMAESIFLEDKSLFEFIFSKDSYIHTDNDNYYDN